MLQASAQTISHCDKSYKMNKVKMKKKEKKMNFKSDDGDGYGYGYGYSNGEWLCHFADCDPPFYLQ